MALEAMSAAVNPYGDGKNSDEKTLIGKIFWVVLHEEEYEKNDGSIGTRITASATAFINEQQAKDGKFNKKLLEKTSARRRDNAPTTAETPDFMDAVDNPFE